MTGFGLSFEDLTAHAARLDALADEMGEATGAIDAAHLGDDAYGKLGAAIATALNTVQDAGRRSMASAAEGLAVASAEVKDAAAEYAETEQDNLRRIDDSGSGAGD